MKTPAQKRANSKYEKEYLKRVVVKLHVKRDADIIELLRGKDNVNAYIKELIRKDM